MTHVHPHAHRHTHVNQRLPKHVNQHRNVLRSTYHSTVSLRVCQGAPMKLLGVHRPSVGRQRGVRALAAIAKFCGRRQRRCSPNQGLHCPAHVVRNSLSVPRLRGRAPWRRDARPACLATGWQQQHLPSQPAFQPASPFRNQR
jgi:hypothetical protein